MHVGCVWILFWWGASVRLLDNSLKNDISLTCCDFYPWAECFSWNGFPWGFWTQFWSCAWALQDTFMNTEWQLPGEKACFLPRERVPGKHINFCSPRWPCVASPGTAVQCRGWGGHRAQFLFGKPRHAWLLGLWQSFYQPPHWPRSTVTSMCDLYH